LIYGAHVVCFCILVAILDPPKNWYWIILLHSH
jgi:ABC-type polysaccharide/polyol phosphate export permease